MGIIKIKKIKEKIRVLEEKLNSLLIVFRKRKIGLVFRLKNLFF